MSFLRFTDEDKARLFTRTARAALGDPDSEQKILEHFDVPGIPDLVDRMLYTDLMTRMPDHLLSIVDRMAMAHGLEVRPPFMEHRMVEFAAAIPASLKLKGTRLKYILRRVASRHLDPTLVRRKKQGFGFPLAYWLRGELNPLLREVVRQSRFIEAGIFEPDYVHGLVDEHVQGKRDHNYRLWLLLNLELWHRLFLEGQSVEAVEHWVDQHARGQERPTPAFTATAS
jgi:asparagine synthase (glutamine-hydrolysing)